MNWELHGWRFCQVRFILRPMWLVLSGYFLILLSSTAVLTTFPWYNWGIQPITWRNYVQIKQKHQLWGLGSQPNLRLCKCDFGLCVCSFSVWGPFQLGVLGHSPLSCLWLLFKLSVRKGVGHLIQYLVWAVCLPLQKCHDCASRLH